MKTSDRVQQLLGLPVNQAPAPARQLVRFLSSKYGLCGEIFVSAYEAYAIVFEQTEGGECHEESRRFLTAIKSDLSAADTPTTSRDLSGITTHHAATMTPSPDLLRALQQAHQALQRAADHIHSREGHSKAYRDAACARDAAQDTLVCLARAADTYDDVWSSLASAARTADAWAANSPTPTPTVAEILDSTCCAVLHASGVTLHSWHVEGGVIEVPASELRPVLEAAYDPNMPDWVALISHDEDGFHVA